MTVSPQSLSSTSPVPTSPASAVGTHELVALANQLPVDSAPADWTEADLEAIEAATQKLGLDLLRQARWRQPWPTDVKWWQEQLMHYSMQDEAVKVRLFRFIDVLPMLSTSADICRHVQEYLGDVQSKLPWPGSWVLALAQPNSLTAPLVSWFARTGAMTQARRFIAGTNLQEVLTAARNERRLKHAFTLDVLGEAVTSEREAEQFFQAYLELLTGISPQVNSWPEIPLIDRDGTQPLPRVNVSIKLSALDSQFDAIDPEGTYQRVAPRLRTLLRTAREHRAYLHFDMESYEKKDLTLEIFQRILTEPEFYDFADVGIVIQCYLKEALEDLQRLQRWAQERGTSVWVRLVKGAYWDHETTLARLHGWPVPVFENKAETDANYELCSRYLLRAYPSLRAAFGSHNLRSIAHAIATARHLKLPPSSYEIQMLYGMADSEKQALVEQGQRIRIYMPYGELIPGMAYLVRRLLENTSNVSFLKAGFTADQPPEQLLMNPRLAAAAGTTATPDTALLTAGSQALVTATPGTVPTPPALHFENEPVRDYSRYDARQELLTGLDQVRRQQGRHVPLWIEGKAVDSSQRLTVLNPSHRSQELGTVAMAEPAHVEHAVTAGKLALRTWGRLSFSERAEYLRKLAAAMRTQRGELAAWIITECGKPWRDADGEVAEAIDFCEYYAQAGELLAVPRGVLLAGEENRFRYLPRGVTAVIAPWNFPLAILTGMTTAALVTGNPVIMKPAEQSSLVAAKLMELCTNVGFPPGVVQYLPGAGETIGAALVDHPDVAMIVFTGSREVGLQIHARAAAVSAKGEKPLVKRVIAEMGGKNAIIVDADCDLDEAVLGVMRSAFGYQGQKCSACSRAVVLSSVLQPFLQRLTEAARSLKVGPAEDPGTAVGPLIDEQAMRRVRRFIQLGRDEGFEVLSVSHPELVSEGFYAGPHIYSQVRPRSDLAQEEVFGPVLAVLEAHTLDEAFDIVNNTQYALTGGIFSRSPANLERACQELQVGNLYLNRAITGALVGRQPFGGFKLSGIGSQAGGPDYLLQFVTPQTITENTLRRGFAPPPPAE